MNAVRSEIAPEDIRAIRESLGLSQVVAGELLGGGPRAFTKYEAGTVKPAASVVKLLRVLEADPSVLELLAGRKSRPMSDVVSGPFEVSAEHVAALTERKFPLLVRRLLGAEVRANHLTQARVHVPTLIHSPDGGEDGRVAWSGGPDRTRFLPSRFCSIELKSGKVSAHMAGRLALSASGAVKEMVRDALQGDGTFLVLCAQPYVQRDIDIRAGRIRKALRDAGSEIEDARVEFRDAEQIALWTNDHPSVATWLKEETQPGMLGPFRSWGHWAGRGEHDSSPWIDDERIADLGARVCASAIEPRGTLRIVGPSGTGKSRLTLEALRPTEDEEATGRYLSDLVLYADLSEHGAEAISVNVQRLADSEEPAIVVLDQCPMDSHRMLTGMILRPGSRLSLITIDEEVPSGTLDQSTFGVAVAPPSVTEAIVDRDLPNVSAVDRRRLARFSRGFPKVAVRVAQAWADSRPIAHATDDDFVKGFVLGRQPEEREQILQAAALLSAFGLVHAEGQEEEELNEIATRGRGITAPDLHAAFKNLVDRGVAQRRGRAVVLQPRPIAMRLTERQWRDWIPAVREDVLTGNGSPALKVLAAKQLAWLNTTDIAREVVSQVCRLGGPFDGFDGISRRSHAQVLSSLAEIDSEVVAQQVERSLNDVPDLGMIKDDVRRHLVWALQKIAFRPESFEDGALLLLRLALAENEACDNNATGQFKQLFPLLLADTAADGTARLSLMEDIARTSDHDQLALLVGALIKASSTDHYSRHMGAETHGSRPALEPWHPGTREEVFTYITTCVTRLAAFAVRGDNLGEAARTGLARNLRGLLGNGFIDVVESVVQQICEAQDCWPESLEGLGHFLLYDTAEDDQDVARRVRSLIAKLEPRTLEARVRHLVTEMPYDYPDGEKLDFEERNDRQRLAVQQVAEDLAAHTDVLASVLPQLSRGEQRQAHMLGRALANVLEAPLDWLEPMVAAFTRAPDDERNSDLLAAYVASIGHTHPETIEVFKVRVAQCPSLAPELPLICFRTGVASADIPLVLGALSTGLLPPSRLMQWTVGRALDDLPIEAVAPLFNSLLEHSEVGFEVGIDLMGMYSHSDRDKLKALRPQVRAAAECVVQWNQSRPSPMAVHHFAELVRPALENGRQDPDARAIAFDLARALVREDGNHQERFVRPVLDLLLSMFPEVTWPLIGQAIVSDQLRAWRFEHVLEGRIGSDRETSGALLQLPEDTLFAWCHAHPDRAPAFVARVAPTLTTYRQGTTQPQLHPVLIRLLDEFGDRDDVLRAANHRMHSFSWFGSLAGYFALYEKPLRSLLEHPKAKVRRWARRALRELSKSIESAQMEDEEREAAWEV